MTAARFAFDTGLDFDIICKSALPEGWEYEVDKKAKPLSSRDANGRPLSLGQSLWLTVRFTNTLYRVKFIVSERLSLEVIMGAAFLNHHVLQTLCAADRIRLKRWNFPLPKK